MARSKPLGCLEASRTCCRTCRRSRRRECTELPAAVPRAWATWWSSCAGRRTSHWHRSGKRRTPSAQGGQAARRCPLGKTPQVGRDDELGVSGQRRGRKRGRRPGPEAPEPEQPTARRARHCPGRERPHASGRRSSIDAIRSESIVCVHLAGYGPALAKLMSAYVMAIGWSALASSTAVFKGLPTVSRCREDFRSHGKSPK